MRLFPVHKGSVSKSAVLLPANLLLSAMVTRGRGGKFNGIANMLGLYSLRVNTKGQYVYHEYVKIKHFEDCVNAHCK